MCEINTIDAAMLDVIRHSINKKVKEGVQRIMRTENLYKGISDTIVYNDLSLTYEAFGKIDNTEAPSIPMTVWANNFTGIDIGSNRAVSLPDDLLNNLNKLLNILINEYSNADIRCIMDFNDCNINANLDYYAYYYAYLNLTELFKLFRDNGFVIASRCGSKDNFVSNVIDKRVLYFIYDPKYIGETSRSIQNLEEMTNNA